MRHRNPALIRAVLGAILAACAVFMTSRAAAQEGPLTPWVGEKGITETVDQIMARERQNIPWRPEDGTTMVEEFFVDRRGLPQNPDSPAVPFWPYVPGLSPVAAHDALPGGVGQLLPQTVSTTFLMVQKSEASPSYVPPDTCGAVGTTQAMVHVNGRVKVFSKAGVVGALNTTPDTFFNSVRNGSAVVDPQCMYDRLTDRWYLVGITTATPNRIVIAVSGTGPITGAASFTFYFFQQDLVAPAGNTGEFADHPKCGVDANALYIGCNMFGGSFTGSTGWCVRKSSITGGGPIVATAFRGICTAGGTGCYTPTGVNNDDPASTEGYFIGPDGATLGRLVLRRVSNPGGSPSISGNINVTVPTTTNPQTVPCLGTTGALDVIDDRLACAQIHLNRASGARTLWTAHHIEVNASGVASTSGNRDGMRWYELQNLTGTPSLRQSGTLFDSTAAVMNYWMGAVAMTGQGHMVLGATQANASTRAQIATAGRLASDTLGTIQAPTLAQTSSTAYNPGSGTQRWGDYSTAFVDPSDDQSVWVFQEYCSATDNWGVRAIKLLAPAPATPSSASPASLTQGASNVNVVITGTSASGTAFYDTDVTYPNRIGATVSGSGVTVNSVSFTDATHITLNVSVSGGAAVGARNVTVTNPDGQVATGVGILTINSASVCPTFSLQPSNSTKCQGENTSFTVAASGSPAPTYQWYKGVNPMGGQTAATLNLSNVQPSDGDTYFCRATNSCGSLDSNVVTLTVNTAPSIGAQPADQSVRAVWNSATFTVTATGTPTLSYQWRRDAVNLTDGGAVSGATTDTLTINPAAMADIGTPIAIDCVVTNLCGSATSNAANYDVHCPADMDMNGFVNGDDFDYFLDKFFFGDILADFDGNTFVNGDDFDLFMEAFYIGC